MYTYDAYRERGFTIAQDQGIPLVEETYEELARDVESDEVIVATYLWGPTLAFQCAMLITSEQDFQRYKKILARDSRHLQYYAVKKCLCNNPKDFTLTH